MEVDLTKKARYIIRYGLIGLVALAAIIAGGIYYYQHSRSYMTLYHAEVKGSMVKVNAKADGTISEMVVEDGEHVEAGDVIAKIDVAVTQDDIDNFQKSVDLAQRNLEEVKRGQTITVAQATPAPAPAPVVRDNSAARERLANAESRMNRMNELFEMGAISAVERNRAAADYSSAQAAASSAPAVSASAAPSTPTYKTMTQPPNPELVKNAEIQLRQAQAALANAKEALKQTEIVAPIAGTVYYSGELTTGTSIKAGDTIVSVGNDDDLWIAVPLTPKDQQYIRLGQFATYEFDGKTLQGSVQEIQEVSFVSDNTDSADDASPDKESESGDTDADTDDNAAEDTSDGDGNGESSGDTEENDEALDEQPVKKQVYANISIPQDAELDLKPGMTTTVKFALYQ